MFALTKKISLENSGSMKCIDEDEYHKTLTPRYGKS